PDRMEGRRDGPTVGETVGDTSGHRAVAMFSTIQCVAGRDHARLQQARRGDERTPATVPGIGRTRAALLAGSGREEGWMLFPESVFLDLIRVEGSRCVPVPKRP